MQSKIHCLLLPVVWYLLNLVSCGPAENRGPGVTGVRTKQCCRCTKPKLSGLHNGLTNYRSLVWHKLSSWSRAGSTQEGLVPLLGPEAGLGVWGARGGEGWELSPHGPWCSQEQKAQSPIRKLHTNNCKVSFWSLNISALWVLCQIVYPCDSPGRGWKHLSVNKSARRNADTPWPAARAAAGSCYFSVMNQ